MSKWCGCEPESLIAKALYEPFERYTAAVSKLIDDQNAWLDWFVWDNACGANAFEANINGKKIVVHDTRSLERVIRLHGNGRGK